MKNGFSNPTALSLEGVSISFPIYHGGSRSLKKSLLFRGSGGRIAGDANQRIVVEALRNVSLTLHAGERTALIGANGSGKTTMLRTMAGIYEPVLGVVRSSGRISPMFDIGLGIDADMSGVENFRLRGLLLGLNSHEIEERLNDVVEFTELGDYLELPVRTYSSGMMTRLTFAAATCFSPEILLMDEWILAGDASFITKAETRLHGFVKKASILVLASHSLEICRRFCDRGVWLDRGEIRADGPIEEVIAAYQASAA